MTSWRIVFLITFLGVGGLRLIAYEGNGFDPHGGPKATADEGSGLDPHGGRITSHEGSGLDPHGKP